MTVEEILAAMQAIIDAAGAEPMSEAQAEEYEELERSLRSVRRDAEIRARQEAYVTPNSTPAVRRSVSSEDAQLRAFDRFIRTGDASEYRAHSEAVPSEGGYLVPSVWRDKIVECQKSFGGVAAAAETISTSTGATLEWPTVNDTADGSYSGAKNVGAITAEGSQFGGGADIEFGIASLGAYKYTSSGAGSAPLRVSVELLQDSSVNVGDLVARKLGERIARKQAAHFATGSGVSEPKGILNGTADAELATANDFANAANGYAKLLEIEDSLDTAYLANASWVMNRTTWTQIRKIVDGIDRPLIMANAEAGIRNGVEKSLLGYPVIIDESFPDPADDVNFLVFGDIRQAYVIRRVSGLTVVVNPYSRAEYGQVEYTAWERADATIQDRCAIAILKGKDA